LDTITSAMADDDKMFSREFFAAARRKAWAKVKKADREKIMSKVSHGFWDSLTPEERSAEMKRRAKVRKKNRETAPRKQP